MGEGRGGRFNLCSRARGSEDRRFPSLRKVLDDIKDHEKQLTSALARTEESLRNEEKYATRVSGRKYTPPHPPPYDRGA